MKIFQVQFSLKNFYDSSIRKKLQYDFYLIKTLPASQTKNRQINKGFTMSMTLNIFNKTNVENTNERSDA